MWASSSSISATAAPKRASATSSSSSYGVKTTSLTIIALIVTSLGSLYQNNKILTTRTTASNAEHLVVKGGVPVDFTSDNVAEEASKDIDKNVIRNLCSTSPEKCSIQVGRSLNECQKPQQSNDNDVKKISGSIFVTPESNFSYDALTRFCKQVEDVTSVLHSFQNISSTIATVVCERTIASHVVGVHEMSPTAVPGSSSSQEDKQQQHHHPLIAFPAWGKYKPQEFKDGYLKIGRWKEYATGFVTPNNRNMCFWPGVPQLASDVQQHQQHQLQLSILTKKDPIILDKILVSGGPFDNFWHGMFILNSWCLMKDNQEISFLVQEKKKNRLDYLTTFADAIGINNSRIVLHDRPVISRSKMMYAAPFKMDAVDWSCLHDTLGVKKEEENNTKEEEEQEEESSYALVYYRGARSKPLLTRDIRLGLHEKFVKAISKELGIQVKTFHGIESFDDQRELFSNAKIVIGPHGAGFANLVFTPKAIPVVELFSPQIADRSCQMFGAHSFREPLPWWPVIVDSMADEDAILGRAVSVVKQAYLYHYGDEMKQ